MQKIRFAFFVSVPVGLVQIGIEGKDSTLDGKAPLVAFGGELGEIASKVDDSLDALTSSIDVVPEKGMIFSNLQPPGFPSSGG